MPYVVCEDAKDSQADVVKQKCLIEAGDQNAKTIKQTQNKKKN